MISIQPIQVKIAGESARAVTLLLVKQRRRVRIPKQVFRHRCKTGQYVVLNPGTLRPEV